MTEIRETLLVTKLEASYILGNDKPKEEMLKEIVNSILEMIGDETLEEPTIEIVVRKHVSIQELTQQTEMMEMMADVMSNPEFIAEAEKISKTINEEDTLDG